MPDDENLARLAARVDKLTCLSEAHTVAITQMTRELAALDVEAPARVAGLLERLAADDARTKPLMMRKLAALAALIRQNAR